MVDIIHLTKRGSHFIYGEQNNFIFGNRSLMYSLPVNIVIFQQWLRMVVRHI